MSVEGTTGLLAGAFRYWEARQAAVSNNLANVATDGFRGERVFARLLEGSGAPVPVGGTDPASGSFTRTDNPLDVALDGEGFLVVETPVGPRHMRGGSLTVDATGTLVDAGGNAVLGQSGPMVLPPGDVEITTQGDVLVDGETLGRLRIERFPAGVELDRQGERLLAAPEAVRPEPDEQTRVRQGHVETSNVDPVQAMVEMIEIQRAYRALERSALAMDGVMDTVSNRLGRVG